MELERCPMSIAVVVVDTLVFPVYILMALHSLTTYFKLSGPTAAEGRTNTHECFKFMGLPEETKTISHNAQQCIFNG